MKKRQRQYANNAIGSAGIARETEFCKDFSTARRSLPCSRRTKRQPGREAQRRQGQAHRAAGAAAPPLVEKAVELALNGDLTALKLCLDRLMSSFKATAEPVILPLPGESLLKKGQAILTAVSEGRFPPPRGRQPPAGGLGQLRESSREGRCLGAAQGQPRI